MTRMPPPSRAAAPAFAAADFRAALAMFATGVTIVTALDADGQPIGLTANSFNSVSLQPPLVLWSLSRHAGSMPAFRHGSHYAINILSAGQKALAERFASKDIARFDGVAHRAGASGVPLIDGAAAVFECFNRSRYEEGDHVIFVGEVEHCARTQGRPAAAVPRRAVFHGVAAVAAWPLQRQGRWPAWGSVGPAYGAGGMARRPR